MRVRPYRLLCAICSLGEGCEAAVPHPDSLLKAFGRDPDQPLTLACNAGEVFAYQDPGTAEDTGEGAEFNIRRDLEILHKLNLFPGATLPARIILHRMLERIGDVAGICGYESTTAEAWKGCPKAASGCYRRGREKGIDAIIPPLTPEERAAEKRDSMEALRQAGAVRVRPHILLCSVCQYGNGTRPPYPEDNLPELLALLFEKPGTLITLAPHADWMMCAPCPFRVRELNACVHNRGSGGLPNQMRDLRVLQKLGLAYGATLPGRELYRLLFERIPGTRAICGLDHSTASVWQTGCGMEVGDAPNYEKGKRLLMSRLTGAP
jgi:hypothetical protein